MTARQARGKRVEARLRVTARTASPASTLMHRHRHALSAPQATGKQQQMQLHVRRARQVTTKARTGSHSACRVRQARLPTLALRRGRPLAWCVLQVSTRAIQVLHFAPRVWRARSPAQAVSQVLAPAPNAPSGSSQQLLRQAPAPSVLPGYSSPLLARLCAPSVTAARRAHGRHVAAQLREIGRAHV